MLTRLPAPDEEGESEHRGREDDDPQEADEQHRVAGQRGQPEAIEPELRLGQPIEQDRADPERDDHDVGHAPAGFEEAAQERPSPDAPLLVGNGVRRQTTEQPEPHREDLGVGPPRVAPELGHHRERERGVADEHDEEDLWTGLQHELEPDDEREADGGGPATEPVWVVGQLPRRDAESPDDRGTQIVERRERIQEVPDRPDDR